MASVDCPRQFSNEDYHVGWICALATEYVAAQVFLDDVHARPTHTATHDNNDYTLGRIGQHNIVIAVLPGGEYGTASAAGVARDMLHSFPNVRIGLMVGIGGGAPSPKHDIRLGDVVVSEPQNGLGGVYQYDFGKNIQNQPFVNTRFLAPPPPLLLTAINGIRAKYEIDGHQIYENIQLILANKKRLKKKYSRPDANTDVFYQPHILHPNTDGNCSSSCGIDEAIVVPRSVRDEDQDDPTIHYGLIASANRLMKDAVARDTLAREKGVLCFEMEAAGLMNHFPCLVIRGICDYSDTHKNKDWQGYAAMTAAAYAKDLLNRIAPNKVEAENKLTDMVENVMIVTKETKSRVEKLQTYAHFDKITKWLNAADPCTDFHQAQALHQVGTGQWLLGSNKYKSWKQDKQSFLWLHGIPGCGKTVLSSTVIADLENSEDTKDKVVYFYFNFADKEKQSAQSAICSLVLQLYQIRLESRKFVDLLFKNCRDGHQQPSLSSLQQVFQDMMQDGQELWIVLDGLDECPFMKWASDDQVIQLQSKLVADDIAQYVHTQVGQMKRWQSRPDIQKSIETELIARSDGMFRWVACQLDSLDMCLTPIDVRKALATLPQTLDDTYARILERIPAEYECHAIRLLQILTYSDTPILLSAAVDALAVEPQRTPAFDAANRMPIPEDIALCCSSLIIIASNPWGDEESGTDSNIEPEKVEERFLRLAHYSVQEYLESNRLRPKFSECFDQIHAAVSLLELCICYLFSINGGDVTVTKDYQFAKFSARSWRTYASIIETQSVNLPGILKQFYLSHKTFNTSCQISLPYSISRRVPGRIISPLVLTSLMNFPQSVTLLLDNGVDIDEKDHLYGTALQAACSRGHENIVQKLLDAGADIGVIAGIWDTPLIAASWGGNSIIVKSLLERGASIHFLGKYNHSALMAAAKEGHAEVVQQLLDAGADIEQCNKEYTCLLFASSYDQEIFVPYLLEPGADIHQINDNSKTALIAASSSGRVTIVRQLLEAGANVNFNNQDRTAIHTAAHLAHEEIVHLLLLYGADVNIIGDEETVLYAASSGGNERIIRKLISKGANVNMASRYWGSALHAASEKHYKTIIQILLDNGADINSISSYYGSALQASLVRVKENIEIYHMLLANGVNINSTDGRNGTALQIASFSGKYAITKALLEQGADVAGFLDTASVYSLLYKLNLECSTEYHNNQHTPVSLTFNIVKLLVLYGADLNTQDGFGRTLLFTIATRHLFPNNISPLLANGALPNIKDCYGATPLLAAVRSECTEAAVVLLLSDLVDIEAVDNTGRSALWWAIKTGNRTIFDLLFQRGMSSAADKASTNDQELPLSTVKLQRYLDSCYICIRSIPRGIVCYACYKCSDEIFWVCLDCFNSGLGCLVKSHNLSRDEAL